MTRPKRKRLKLTIHAAFDSSATAGTVDEDEALIPTIPPNGLKIVVECEGLAVVLLAVELDADRGSSRLESTASRPGKRAQTTAKKVIQTRSDQRNKAMYRLVASA